MLHAQQLNWRGLKMTSSHQLLCFNHMNDANTNVQFVLLWNNISWHNCILSAQTKRNLTLFYNTVNSGTEWSNPLESECLQPWPSFVTIVKVNELTLEVSQTCILWCFDKAVRDHQIEFRVGTIRKQSKKFVFPYTH